MPRVDAHAHLVPTRYRREIEAAGAFAPPPAGPVEISAMMERYEIDAAIISSGPPGVNLGGATSSAETARILNQELAEIVVAEPARFAALAALPLPGIDEALAELAYCLDELALDGVALLSNENGVYVGDPSLDPLMAELDRRGAYVFVHPTAPPYAAPLDHPEWLYEFPFETTRVITNLIYSGALDRFPRIRWQFPHLGGTVPFLAHRLASLAERDPRGTAEVELGAIEYLRRLYYDTGLSNAEITITSALGLIPAGQVVFGTDWPYAVMPPDGGDPAPDLDRLQGVARDSLEFDHVTKLVPRLAEALAGRRSDRRPGPARAGRPPDG